MLAAVPDAGGAGQLQQLWQASPDGLVLPLEALQPVAASCPSGSSSSGSGGTQASVSSILTALAGSGGVSGSAAAAAANGAAAAAAAAPARILAPGDGSSMRRLLSEARERLLAEEKELLGRVRAACLAAWPADG